MKPITRRHVLRRFARNSEGVAAVEFGIVLLPFLAILFVILETAIVFFAGQLLETGVADAARLIRTGQAQDSDLSSSDFKEAICANVFALLDCEAGLKVDVRRLESFGTSVPSPIDDSGDFSADDFTFDPGTGGEVVLVRAFYEWPIIVPHLGSPGNLTNGNYLLAATATFRNEPF